MSRGPAASRRVRGEAVLRDPLVRELLEARLACVLATLEPDGSVHAVPMWLAADGEAILLATGSRSRKARNLRRDDRATVVLHDSRPGYEVCGATMRGRIEFVAGAGAAALVQRVHDRYVTAAGQDLPEAHTFLASDDLALRFRPEAAVVWDERGSAAASALRTAGAALPLAPTTPRVEGQNP